MKKAKQGKEIVGFGAWVFRDGEWKRVGFLFNNRGEGHSYLSSFHKSADKTKVSAIRSPRKGDTTKVPGKSWADVRG